MDVKEAVTQAKKFLADLYNDERVSNVGLEEVEFEPHKRTWVITVGFSRPWDEPRNPFASIGNQPSVLKRSYKVVRINDMNGEVLSIKNREVAG